MPTGAKIFSAVAFALLAALAAHVYIAVLPEGSQVKWFREISAFIGFFCGWFVMGALVGQGNYKAMGTGVRTAVTILVFVLLVFSIHEMVNRSMNMIYDGPMEALLGVFDVMLYFGKLLLASKTPYVLFFGGALLGLMAERSGRRWT